MQVNTWEGAMEGNGAFLLFYFNFNFSALSKLALFVIGPILKVNVPIGFKLCYHKNLTMFYGPFHALKKKWKSQKYQ